MWALWVTLFDFGFTTPCHTFRIYVLALKIPLLIARYHGYLFEFRPYIFRSLKRRSDSILGTFYHDSLHVNIFKTLITSLFEDIWFSN